MKTNTSSIFIDTPVLYMDLVSSTRFNDLPKEVQSKIFANLSCEDLERASLVSQKWSSVISSNMETTKKICSRYTENVGTTISRKYVNMKFDEIPSMIDLQNRFGDNETSDWHPKFAANVPAFNLNSSLDIFAKQQLWAHYSDMMTQEEFEKSWNKGKPPKFFTGSRDQIDPIYLGLQRCTDCNQQRTKFVNCIAKRTGNKWFLWKGHGHFAVCCEDIRKHVKDFPKQLKIERWQRWWGQTTLK